MNRQWSIFPQLESLLSVPSTLMPTPSDMNEQLAITHRAERSK